MFEIFKFILLFIVGIIIASGVFFTSVFNNNNISKDDTVNNYMWWYALLGRQNEVKYRYENKKKEMGGA